MTLNERPKTTTAVRWTRIVPAIVALAVSMSSATDAGAGQSPIAVGEVAPPPAESGIDAAVLREAANAEIQQMDVSRLSLRRRIVVSLALTRAVAEETIACTVNAMLRDAQTGSMIAIIEGGAHATGPASTELRKRVADAAVRSAVRRIPGVLSAR